MTCDNFHQVYLRNAKFVDVGDGDFQVYHMNQIKDSLTATL